eukprot:gene12806-biopygen23000
MSVQLNLKTDGINVRIDWELQKMAPEAPPTKMRYGAAGAGKITEATSAHGDTRCKASKTTSYSHPRRLRARSARARVDSDRGTTQPILGSTGAQRVSKSSKRAQPQILVVNS